MFIIYIAESFMYVCCCQLPISVLASLEFIVFADIILPVLFLGRQRRLMGIVVHFNDPWMKEIGSCCASVFGRKYSY